MSCFHHHDIRVATRSTMTTATTFPPKSRWFARVHYLVFRKARTRSRTSLRILRSLLPKLNSCELALEQKSQTERGVQKGTGKISETILRCRGLRRRLGLS